MALAVGIICVPRVYNILTQSTQTEAGIMALAVGIICVPRVHNVPGYTNRRQYQHKQTVGIMALAVGIIGVPRVYNILTQSTQTDGRYDGSGSRYNWCI